MGPKNVTPMPSAWALIYIYIYLHTLLLAIVGKLLVNGGSDNRFRECLKAAYSPQ